MDDTIERFLADGGYKSLDEWMLDSEYLYEDGEWFYSPDYPDENIAGQQVDPVGTIMGAIEASGFE